MEIQTVVSLGNGWSHFDQRAMSEQKAGKVFADYFSGSPLRMIYLTRLRVFIWAVAVAVRRARWRKEVGCLHCTDSSMRLMCQKSF